MSERLRRIFNKLNIQVIAFSNKNLLTAVGKKQGPIPTSFRSGIYEIPLQLHNGQLIFYIDMTTRKNFDGIKEHKNYLGFNKQFTALSRLFSKSNVAKIDFDNVKIISRHSIALKALIREFTEIHLSKEEICNDSVSFLVPHISIKTLNKVYL